MHTASQQHTVSCFANLPVVKTHQRSFKSVYVMDKHFVCVVERVMQIPKPILFWL